MFVWFKRIITACVLAVLGFVVIYVVVITGNTKDHSKDNYIHRGKVIDIKQADCSREWYFLKVQYENISRTRDVLIYLSQRKNVLLGDVVYFSKVELKDFFNAIVRVYIPYAKAKEMLRTRKVKMIL